MRVVTLKIVQPGPHFATENGHESWKVKVGSLGSEHKGFGYSSLVRIQGRHAVHNPRNIC